MKNETALKLIRNLESKEIHLYKIGNSKSLCKNSNSQKGSRVIADGAMSVHIILVKVVPWYSARGRHEELCGNCMRQLYGNTPARRK